MSKISLSDDLITITQKLMMARERSEVMNVASDCTALIERLIALEDQGSIAAYQKTRSAAAAADLILCKKILIPPLSRGIIFSGAAAPERSFCLCTPFQTFMI